MAIGERETAATGPADFLAGAARMFVSKDVLGAHRTGRRMLKGASSRGVRVSSISGSTSSVLRGGISARTANNDLRAASSRINRSPSICMVTSLPGISNSLRMRTAWFRPLRNDLTSRMFASKRASGQAILPFNLRASLTTNEGNRLESMTISSASFSLCDSNISLAFPTLMCAPESLLTPSLIRSSTACSRVIIPDAYFLNSSKCSTSTRLPTELSFLISSSLFIVCA